MFSRVQLVYIYLGLMYPEKYVPHFRINVLKLKYGRLFKIGKFCWTDLLAIGDIDLYNIKNFPSLFHHFIFGGSRPT